MKALNDMKKHCDDMAKQLIALGKRPPALPTTESPTGTTTRKSRRAKRRAAEASLEQHNNEPKRKRQKGDAYECEACGITHKALNHTKKGITKLKKMWEDKGDPRADDLYDVNSSRKERFDALVKIAKKTGTPMAPAHVACDNCGANGHFARQCGEEYKSKSSTTKKK